MTEYIIKCIQCKKEFDQVNPYTRLCESCRMSNYKSQVLISQKKQSIKRKEQRNQQTKHLKKTCPVCQYEFKTAKDSKKYCSKRCLRKRLTFPDQIINKEKQLIILEEKILNNNKHCEEKIIEIEKLADKKNYELKKLHSEYTEKLDFMRSVI